MATVQTEKINTTQLVKAFAVSRATVNNWISRDCPHEKTDRGNMFVLSEVIKWHQERFLKNSGGDTGKFAESKAMREHFKALLCELEFKEKSGELIPIADVKRISFESGRMTRDQLLAIPSRLAAILAAEKDPKKVNEILTNELRQALEHLVNKFNEELLQKLLQEEAENDKNAN